MIDDINDVRHTSTLAKFEEAVLRSSPVSASVMTTYSDLPEAIRNHLAELEMFIGDCDGQWTALQTSDENVVLDNGTIDASGAVKAFNGIVAALHSSDHAQTWQEAREKEITRLATIAECAALCESVGNDEFTNVHRVMADRIRALSDSSTDRTSK